MRQRLIGPVVGGVWTHCFRVSRLTWLASLPSIYLSIYLPLPPIIPSFNAPRPSIVHNHASQSISPGLSTSSEHVKVTDVSRTWWVLIEWADISSGRRDLSDPLQASRLPVKYRILCAAGELEERCGVNAMLSGAPAVTG